MAEEKQDHEEQEEQEEQEKGKKQQNDLRIANAESDRKWSGKSTTEDGHCCLFFFSILWLVRPISFSYCIRPYLCVRKILFFLLLLSFVCVLRCGCDRGRTNEGTRRPPSIGNGLRRLLLFFFLFFPFLPSFLCVFDSFSLSFPQFGRLCVCVCVCCYCGGRLVRHSGAPIVGWMSPFIGSNSRKKMIINPKFGPCYPLVTRRTPVFVVRVVPKFRAEFFFWLGRVCFWCYWRLKTKTNVIERKWMFFFSAQFFVTIHVSFLVVRYSFDRRLNWYF